MRATTAQLHVLFRFPRVFARRWHHFVAAWFVFFQSSDDGTLAVSVFRKGNRGDGRRFIVHAYELLTAFVELESAIRLYRRNSVRSAV
jgi:hypothetical protein